MPKIISDEWSERKQQRSVRPEATKPTSMRLPRSVYYDLSEYAGATHRTLTEAFVVAWDHYYRYLKSEGRWPPKHERHDTEDLMANKALDLGHAKQQSQNLELEKKGGVWSPPKRGGKLRT